MVLVPLLKAVVLLLLFLLLKVNTIVRCLEVLNPKNVTTELNNNNKFHFLNKIHPNQTYNCNKVIFEEDNKISLIQSDGPNCWLPPSSSHLVNDVKDSSDIDPNLDIKYFTISNEGHDKNITENSYIEIWIRICSEPRGQVLVTDTITKQTITAFVNRGTAYQCNHWLDKEMQQFISNSNSLQVEYWSPVDDYYQVNYTYLNEYNQKGKRHIQYFYTGNFSDDTSLAFDLNIEYKQIPFSSSFKFTENVTTADYLPNAAQFFLFKQKHLDLHNFYFGIVAEISHLDLDFDRGDYLMVGGGNQLSFRKNSKFQIISHKIDEYKPADKQRVLINATSAILGIVTHNSLKRKDMALKFSWNISNTRNLTDNDDSYNDEQLMAESIRICFQYIGFDLWKSTIEQEFKLEFVHHVNKYLIDVDKSSSTMIIDESIIVIPDDDLNSHTNKSTTINLAIANPYHPEYPLVSKEALYSMYFGSFKKSIVFKNVTITDCSTGQINYSQILITIFVILVLTTLILAIIWRIEVKNSMEAQMFHKKNKKFLKQLHKKGQFD